MKFMDIFLLVNLSRCSARGILQGVLKYATKCPAWRLHICNLSDHGCEQVCNALKNDNVDGLITSELDNGPLSSLLEHSTRPLVVVGTRKSCLPSRSINMSVVTSDERALGATAAQQLLYLGRFKTYGFVPIKETTYQYLCDLRKEGFAMELKKSGISAVHYLPPEDQSIPDDEALAQWIRSIDKPAALCAGCDRRAIDIINTCTKCNIKIPEEVRVLGIDNDEFLCLSTKPTLSSLQRDSAAEGFAASQQLDNLLRQKRSSTTKRRLHICKYSYQLITRGSTSTLPPGLELVRRACEFIRLNLADCQTVAKIADHMHISQRLLYLRFNEFSDKSLQETINGERMKTIKQLIVKGKMSHAEIARRAGLDSATAMRRLFKRQEGKSIREWRMDTTF